MSALHEWVLRIGLVWALTLVLGFLAAAVRGPSVLDRVLATSGFATCLVAVLALLAFLRSEAGYLDAALALALLAYVGTVAAARFREPGGGP
jgi:multicomponent Na+:H+ antiporter subunit F